MQPLLDHPSLVPALAAVLAGVALASACGLRAFLPLLGLALASRTGLVHLAPNAGWIGSDGALWALALATVLELVADKVPVLDHVLDVVATLVRPAAAAVAAWATFGAVDPRLAAVASLILGAGALGIHLFKAKARLGSTLLTLGHANPLLSLAEDAAAAALSATALLAPIVVLVLIAAALAWLLTRRGPGR